MFLPRLAAAAGAFLALIAVAEAAGGTVHLTLIDALSNDEVAEDTTIFVNGEQVAHFRLTPDHRAASVDAEIAAASHYEYALCGTATVKAANGEQTERRVNDSGTIADPDGRAFSAFTQNYTAFFLVDVTEDKPHTSIAMHLGPRCVGPVAEKQSRSGSG